MLLALGKMNTVSCLWFVLVISFCSCLPPHRRSDQHLEDNKIDEKENDYGYSMEQLGIEYTRYLQQVVETLEKDEVFKKKLESAKEHEIKSAKIAEELEYVNHHVRSKLDELKRTELQRLRELARQAYGKGEDRDTNPFGHLDHENPNTFEIKDLKKLIHKVAQDLEEADKKRKEEFKTYEMGKHFEREQMLKNMTEEERKKFIQQEEDAKRREEVAAKRVHHPGSKQQLEEVWENQDHMSKNDFNPRTFFVMHDVDGNGFLDEEEIKTLFVKELDKLYASGSLTGDMVERAEEMERMREHVFNEVDKNKDRLISWEEFYSMSAQPDFNEDPGWQPLDHNGVYSPEEWQAYEQQRLAEMEKLRREGKLQPDQGYYPAQPHGGYPDPNVHYGANGYPQQYYPPQGGHPQQQQQQQQPPPMVNNHQPMAGNPQQMAGYPQQQMAGSHQQQMAGYPHQQQMAGYPQAPPVGQHAQQQAAYPQQVPYYQNQPQSNGVPVQPHHQAQPVVQTNNIPQQQQQPVVAPAPVPQQPQAAAVPAANVNPPQQPIGAPVPIEQNKVVLENKVVDHQPQPPQAHFESKTN